VVSAHSSEGTDLRPGRFPDLASMVRYDASRVDALTQRVAELKEQVSGLSGSVDDRQVRKYERRAAAGKGPAGLLPVTGPGVTVTLSDAPQGTGEDTPDTVDNPNLLLVHQQDIQAVVNALWAGGAEAMTLQNERVVSTTGIKCVGNTVVLHGVPYSPPYRIAAIGPVPQMLTSVRSSPYIQLYLQEVSKGLGWKVAQAQDLDMPGYDGTTELSYARPADRSGTVDTRR
jgi:uncharacterized protein YlxW (UPF0749 family)